MQIAMLNSWIMPLCIENCDNQDLYSEYLFNILFVYKCHYFLTLHKFVEFNVIEFKRYDLYVIRRLEDFTQTVYNVKYHRISSREWRVISTFAFFFSFPFFLWSFMRSMSSGMLERLRILSRLKPTKVLTWRGSEDYIDIYTFSPSYRARGSGRRGKSPCSEEARTGTGREKEEKRYRLRRAFIGNV